MNAGRCSETEADEKNLSVWASPSDVVVDGLDVRVDTHLAGGSRRVTVAAVVVGVDINAKVVGHTLEYFRRGKEKTAEVRGIRLREQHHLENHG